MKKLIAVLLCLATVLSLAGCTFPRQRNDETSVAETTVPPQQLGNFAFTEENFPVLSGSLAALPLGEAVVSTVLSISRDAAKQRLGDIFEGSTTEKYNGLVDGKYDIILAYEPSADALKYAKDKNFEWEMTPIGVDALVFICSNLNGVDSLTTQQIKDIYTGKITNWNQVGGENSKILAYQRNKQSGSQTLFDKIINLGGNLVDPPKEYVIGSMIGLLEAIADYDNSKDALGYTVYYYLTNMNSDKLSSSKLLAVDGVKPTNETIASGEYPFVNDFYVVIPKGLKDDDPAKVLYNWIISEQGKQLIKNENYIAK